VTGLVDPKKMYPNNQGQPGDLLILTKKQGVGIICTANRIQEASKEAMEEAITSMTTLNKRASEICRDFEIHACTDVTGFGFLGHLHEMMDGRHSCRIDAKSVPVMEAALAYADEFYLTAAAQKNRNHLEGHVRFEQVSFAMEEVLFDPQTSGGLLVAVKPQQADELVKRLGQAGLPAAIVGEIIEKTDTEILVQ
jgi:selenide,water dikinase